jgi:hypothetical protein
MQKTRDFEHQFVHRGAVGGCRIRVYEQLGERPVVVATQGRGPFGEPEPLILVEGARTIAADLIEEGIIHGSYRAVTVEMLEKMAREGDVRSLCNSAPFWFVVERLQHRQQLTFLWFQGYYELAPGELGNLIREDTTREAVEGFIGASLDD